MAWRYSSEPVSELPAAEAVLPGAIALTRMLSPASSVASVVVNPTTAILVMPYSDLAGKAPAEASVHDGATATLAHGRHDCL